MATKFVTNLDLNQNQILNGTFEKLAADPATGLFEGRMFYHTGEDALKYYTGSAWDTLIKGVSSAGTHASALTVGESNGAVTLTLNLADASNAGLLSATFYSLLNGATASNTNDTLVKRDSSGRFQATSPSADADVATKSYVDAQRSGLDVKQSVRVATTGPQTLASDFEAGDEIDGVTLVAGDRILIKNQSTGSENGIYTVNASGAPTRATDADSNTEVTAGMFTFVEEGTSNADSGWVLTTNGSITLGSTSLAFAQFSGAGQITAGAGLTKTGNQLDVGGTTDRITVNSDSVDIASTYVGQSSITTLGTITTGTWTATAVGVAYGGTGATTAATARSNSNLAATSAGFDTSDPVLARVSAKTIGNASDTSFTITHNLGTRDVIVQVFDTTTYETVIADTVRASTNTVTVTFSSAPSSNAYRVVISG